MGLNFAQVVATLLLIGSMVAVSTANKDWKYGNYSGWGFNHGRNHHLNKTKLESSKIIVGGSENSWHFGFDYKQWALNNASFYVNDSLVFKYDPPSDTTRPHSVYLFRKPWSFMNCDLSQATMVGNQTQGSGEGFEFVLNKWQPYYFACGEHDGIHCKDGLMKFFVFPRFRSWHY